MKKVRIYYSPKYVSSGYAFDTTRKAKWIADSLAESPIPGIELLEPQPITRDQVAQLHDVDYIRAIETGAPRDLAESQGFSWDAGLRYESSDRVLLDIVGHGANYLPAVDRSLKEIDRRGPRFDLCLYNAGMDPYENCSTGGMPGITREVLAGRERMVFDWCQDRHLPVAFVLAGGYIGSRLNKDGPVDLHRLTLSSAAEAGLTLMRPPLVNL